MENKKKLVPEEFVGLNQSVYQDVRYWREYYTKCYKCKEYVGTTVMYIDNDGSQRHFKCLSEERRKEIG